MLDWGQHTQTVQRMYQGLLSMGVGAALFYCVAVLFGAPINEGIMGTLMWGLVMSAVAVGPAALSLGLGLKPADLWLWRDLFLSGTSSHSLSETICYWGAVGSCIGAWCGAIPIPLDWDRPWQVWPIPCIYGALLGYIIGTVGSSIYGYFYSTSRINRIV